MPNWVDLIIVLLFGGAVVLEAKRGFGRAMFDLAALLVAVKFVPMASGPVAGSLQFVSDPSANSALVYILLFVLAGTALIFLGKFLYDTTLISAEVFDTLLGGICGLGIGTILCHAFVRAIALHAGSLDVTPEVIATSSFGTEFFTFDTYHRLLDAIYRFQRSSE